jgi:hypothetical protein
MTEFGRRILGLCFPPVLTSFLIAAGIRYVWRPQGVPDASVRARLPAGVRRTAIAFLFGAAVYLFMWPHSP